MLSGSMMTGAIWKHDQIKLWAIGNTDTQPGVILPLGAFAVPGDIIDCHICMWGHSPGLEQLESRDATEPPKQRAEWRNKELSGPKFQ